MELFMDNILKFSAKFLIFFALKFWYYKYIFYFCRDRKKN